MTLEEHGPRLHLLRHDGPVEVGQLAAQGPELLVLPVLRPLLHPVPAYLLSDGVEALVDVTEAAAARPADVTPVGDGPDAVGVDDQ